MAPLSSFLAAVAPALAMLAPAASIEQWRPYVTQASLRCGIPTSWVEQVMRAESNGSTRLDGRPIRSRAGAMGLMQLMPGTWNAMRRDLGLGTDPDHPRDNILAGTCYLRAMYDRFGYPGLFAAYNAGPARYAEHLTTGRSLPGETVDYLHKVAGRGGPVFSAPVERDRESLFVVLRPSVEKAGAAMPEPPRASLFAVRHDVP